ncbi:MAG: fatty acid desaturase family protein [Sphingomonadaceae bacterium]|nr:fatty acid desaturase family protein [Sphingomonadaceae bacterium]
MPAVKAANPRQIFGNEDWKTITAISQWRGVWLILHAWSVVALAAFGASWAWDKNWIFGLVATPVALFIIGGRQLGLAILMHEGAHGLLHPNRKLNNFLGQWPGGAATGSDLHAYRTYHLTHHKFTQQPEDPDLPLSKPFPTSGASLRRKAVRDMTGQTFFRQRRAQFATAWRGLKAMLTRESSNASRETSAGRIFNLQSRSGIDAPVANVDGAKATARTVGRFLLVQILLLAISLVLWGWMPFVLWLVALATTFQLFLRIRNIAEHACTTTGSEDPFTHARTTYANLIERTTVAPYWVNYHSEHHLFMGVPCYRLRHAHMMLGRRNYHQRMTIERSYAAVIRRVIASPLPI